MRKIILILGTIILLGGCAPTTGIFSSNDENSVEVNVTLLDRGKGSMHPPTLAVAEKWCGNYGKKPKFLKKTINGFLYSCN